MYGLVFAISISISVLTTLPVKIPLSSVLDLSLIHILIISETFSLQGLGLAISNRLEKASGGKDLSELGSGPLRIVMVCTGNTCRSPMSEGLFRRLWKDAGEPYSVEVISRGVTACLLYTSRCV